MSHQEDGCFCTVPWYSRIGMSVSKSSREIAETSTMCSPTKKWFSCVMLCFVCLLERREFLNFLCAVLAVGHWTSTSTALSFRKRCLWLCDAKSSESILSCNAWDSQVFACAFNSTYFLSFLFDSLLRSFYLLPFIPFRFPPSVLRFVPFIEYAISLLELVHTSASFSRDSNLSTQTLCQCWRSGSGGVLSLPWIVPPAPDGESKK